MNENLADLIRDYQAKVYEALVLMCRSGIRMPSSNMHWAETDIPQKGLLDGDIAYQKHGVGCTVYLLDGEVDFDFGARERLMDSIRGDCFSLPMRGSRCIALIAKVLSKVTRRKRWLRGT